MDRAQKFGVKRYGKNAAETATKTPIAGLGSRNPDPHDVRAAVHVCCVVVCCHENPVAAS
jgi:hypothetical protein